MRLRGKALEWCPKVDEEMDELSSVGWRNVRPKVDEEESSDRHLNVRLQDFQKALQWLARSMRMLGMENAALPLESPTPADGNDLDTATPFDAEDTPLLTPANVDD